MKETKQEGCLFCNGEIDITRKNIGMSIFKTKYGTKYISLCVYEDGYKEDECLQEETFEINYCLKCGKKLVKE